MSVCQPRRDVHAPRPRPERTRPPRRHDAKIPWSARVGMRRPCRRAAQEGSLPDRRCRPGIRGPCASSAGPPPDARGCLVQSVAVLPRRIATPCRHAVPVALASRRAGVPCRRAMTEWGPQRGSARLTEAPGSVSDVLTDCGRQTTQRDASAARGGLTARAPSCRPRRHAPPRQPPRSCSKLAPPVAGAGRASQPAAGEGESGEAGERGQGDWSGREARAVSLRGTRCRVPVPSPVRSVRDNRQPCLGRCEGCAALTAALAALLLLGPCAGSAVGSGRGHPSPRDGASRGCHRGSLARSLARGVVPPPRSRPHERRRTRQQGPAGG